MSKIKIGTRGSKLAMWQAEEVRRKLSEVHPELETELVVIHTKGDKILDTALSKIGDKGLFTRELEQALLDSEIDIAVHSLKDMPTELPEGLMFGGVLERGEVRDAFISRDGRRLSELTANDKVATSSLRRKAQLLALFPHLTVVDIRGNVDTRIQKMQDGHCDGLVVAGAGMERLGLSNLITEYLDPQTVLPAVSQGAIAIEMREDDEDIYELVDLINHFATWQAIVAERAFLRTMEGGCQIPLACYTSVVEGRFRMDAMVASLDGTKLIKDSFECNPEEASEEAIMLAQRMLENGAEEILNIIRGNE